MAKAPLSRTQYIAAMQKVAPPSARIAKFLRFHAKNRSLESDTEELRAIAGYKHFGGINLQYGKLADRLIQASGYRLKRGDASLSLLCEFEAPGRRRITTLRMYPEVAEAMRFVGWI